MTIALVPEIETIRYGREIFPGAESEFNRLFNNHGVEARNRVFLLDFKRLHQIEFEKRLVWMVARTVEMGKPVGYSLHYWYFDMHYRNDKVAVDDLWYVDPEFRRKGIGRMVKMMGHAELAKQGVTRVSDTIRMSYGHNLLMRDIGFEPAGIRWLKDL